MIALDFFICGFDLWGYIELPSLTEEFPQRPPWAREALTLGSLLVGAQACEARALLLFVACVWWQSSHGWSTSWRGCLHQLLVRACSVLIQQDVQRFFINSCLRKLNLQNQVFESTKAVLIICLWYNYPAVNKFDLIHLFMRNVVSPCMPGNHSDSDKLICYNKTCVVTALITVIWEWAPSHN